MNNMSCIEHKQNSDTAATAIIEVLDVNRDKLQVAKVDTLVLHAKLRFHISLLQRTSEVKKMQNT